MSAERRLHSAQAMWKKSARCFTPLVFISLLGGCTQYQFDVVCPPDLVRSVVKDREAVIGRGPVEYRLTVFENRLVTRIFNRAGEPIRILGERSVVVDPGRQSHPLRTQTIAPGTYVKMILPPMRPQAEPSGPTFSIGLGTGFGGRRGFYDPFWGGSYGAAPGYTIYDGGDVYWDWSGETDAEVHLVMQMEGQQPFVQEFVFHRRKVR